VLLGSGSRFDCDLWSLFGEQFILDNAWCADNRSRNDDEERAYHDNHWTD
jgi:hypothetical protein